MALGGLFAALAGLYVSMVTLTGDPNIGPAYTLNSIAAVVIGGVALSGGVGSPLGAVLGAFILKTISGLMFFSGLPPLAQPFFEGAILAIAIALGALWHAAGALPAGAVRLMSRRPFATGGAKARRAQDRPVGSAGDPGAASQWSSAPRSCRRACSRSATSSSSFRSPRSSAFSQPARCS